MKNIKRINIRTILLLAGILCWVIGMLCLNGNNGFGALAWCFIGAMCIVIVILIKVFRSLIR
ncbi:MAG: hypothetical protein WC614_13605 [bacterium]